MNGTVNHLNGRLKMNEKLDIDIIKRYANGRYSFRDVKQIACWFENRRYHNDLKSVLERHWNEFSGTENPEEKDLSELFGKLRLKILGERHHKNVVKKLRIMYMRVAAILLIPLLTYSAFSLVDRSARQSVPVDSWVEIVSPKGTRTHVNLPDGTKVSLNGSTQLLYHSGFERNRLVRLKGEAWFDVFHDAGSPFIVQTGEMDVRVLGTKFSVASFDDEKISDVIVEEGKVLLTGKEKGKSFSKKLNPNEGFFFNKETHSGEVLNVDAKTLTAWKEGILIFRSEHFGDVLKRMGRWYDVRFEVLDKEVEKFRYRATFHNEPLEEVLRLISLTAPIEYKIYDRNMNNDGIYEKRMITIGLKAPCKK